MELTSEDIGVLDGAVKACTISGSGGYIRPVVTRKVVGMDEIDISAVFDTAVKLRILLDDIDTVPTDLGDLEVFLRKKLFIEPRDMTAQDAESLDRFGALCGSDRFGALIKKKLHSKTDTKKWNTASYKFVYNRNKSVPLELTHRIVVGTDPRENNPVAILQINGIIGKTNLGAEILKCFRNAQSIPRLVIYKTNFQYLIPPLSM